MLSLSLSLSLSTSYHLSVPKVGTDSVFRPASPRMLSAMRALVEDANFCAMIADVETKIKRYDASRLLADFEERERSHTAALDAFARATAAAAATGATGGGCGIGENANEKKHLEDLMAWLVDESKWTREQLAAARTELDELQYKRVRR